MMSEIALITQSMGGITVTVEKGKDVLMPRYDEDVLPAMAVMAINFLNAGCNDVRIPFSANDVVMGWSKSEIVSAIKRQFFLFQNGRQFAFVVERKGRTTQYILTVRFKIEKGA